MLELKLIHISKRGPRFPSSVFRYIASKLAICTMRNVAREHERHSSCLLSIPVNPMTPKQKVLLGAIHKDNLAQKHRFESYSIPQSLTAHRDFFHYSDVIMGAMASQPASRLFTQPFIQTQVKENIKAPRHWSLCGEFIGDRWILRTNVQ